MTPKKTLLDYSWAKRLALIPLLLLALLTQVSAQLSTTYNASGTFVVPTGVTEITVECWGGGGRGGSRTNSGAGGGGGGGAYARSILSVTPSTTYTVTVGAGSSTTAAGGDSRFRIGGTDYVLAKGGASGPDDNTAGANGGASGSCIGTVVFSGGNGATANTNGGGGGSSAGTAAIGNNGSVSGGASAPTGGGNGGNGQNGSNGNGAAGAAPGGGGGGCRANMMDRNGGTGGSGRVVVSYQINGACMPAVSFNAIANNACTNLGMAISGQPTTLGTAPGNARLYSVELIVEHTYNADLDISLTSPGGTTLNLCRDKGGAADNIGNPATCATTVLTLTDASSTPLPTGDTPNMSGTYAPEQALSGFTGNPNGNWTINVCDDANNDVGFVRYVKLNFCTVPQITASSSNSPVCSSGTLNLSVTATGTAPLTYLWTGTGSFSPGTSSTTPSVTGAATGNYNIAVSSACGSTNTNVAVTVAPAPSATIAYTRSAYCTSASSANVTRSGTPGGTYSSAAGLTINASTGTVTPSTSTPGTYTITYTIAAVAPCGQFQTTTQLTIDALPTAAAAGSDQSTCAVDAISLAANTPVVGIGTWNVVSGPSTSASQFSAVGSPTATFLSDGGPGTYTLRWSIDNGACSPSTDLVVITVNACTYYSRNTGNVGDPIWSLTPNGTAGAALWNGTTNMVVQATHTVTNTADLQVGSITVDNGGTLVLGAFNLTANGALVDVNGTLSANDNSTLTLAGSGAHVLDLAATTSFWNLTCNTPGGTTLTGNASMRNTLLLVDGAFDCTANAVVLESTATRTGRLGPVGTSASYLGNLRVDRHIPAGATNWRMMGSPVAGRTVNDWKDDYYTAGFPGSHSPGFSNPVGSGILWPSIRWYNESHTGAGINDGLVGATSTAQPLAIGQGFAAWCGTGLNTTTAFTVDVTGNPNIAQTAITLPMSYTSTGAPATDGWNMVSNPLPSPIAFDLINRGADVADYITYFNPANGNLATWDIGDGVGTNGGSNVIQSSQAFWLKATGPAVTTTVDEQDKVEGNTGGFFGGAQVQTANMVRLRIESAINQYSDETVVLFSNGQPAFEGSDVPKFVFAHPEAPQIASLSDDGAPVAINAYGPYSTQISIPVKVDVALNGTYTIVVTGLQHIGLSCMRLEDLATGTSTPLTEGATYSFTALAADNAAEARFLLHASAPMALTATDATCHGRDDGSASLALTSGPVDVIWSTANGTVLLEQNGVLPGTSELVALNAGEYTVQVAGDAACGALHTTFIIEEPAGIEVEAITLPTTCPESEDGTIHLTVLGGVAPYTYGWSNQATAESIEVAAGTYTVLITDANGCTFAPQDYVVGAGEGPQAGISVENSLVLVGEELVFSPATLDGVSNTWVFGDGHTSTDLEAIHSYTVPGTYTVTLNVDNGDCTGTASLEVQVQTGTGILTAVGHTLNAYVSGDRMVVDHDFGTQQPVIIRVFSTGGQLAQEHKVSHAPARITLPTSELATGIWLVRVSSGNRMRTFSLPIVH